MQTRARRETLVLVSIRFQAVGDDEGDADKEDREAIGRQIAEALEGYTLTTRLN